MSWVKATKWTLTRRSPEFSALHMLERSEGSRRVLWWVEVDDRKTGACKFAHGETDSLARSKAHAIRASMELVSQLVHARGGA